MLSIKKEMNLIKVEKEPYVYRFSWIQLARPMTFTGTISPILAGTGLAALKGQINLGNFIILLLATLLIQTATNMLNDYYDFRNGQDQEKWTVKSETGPAHQAVPVIAGTLLVIAALLGMWLAIHSTPWIILAGVCGIIFGYLYSAGSRPLCSLGLGEFVAAIFLGFMTTSLAYVVQGFPMDSDILSVSLPFALLIASMILTNNIRDIEKDRPFRRTLAIVFGRKKAVLLLAMIVALAYLWIVTLILTSAVSWLSVVVILALPIAIKLGWNLRNNASKAEKTNSMKLAAIHHWVFGLLFACSIWMGLL
ncbi:1,4-dihydroxy-2-naphthoate octaprenyltransferase [Lentibacillus sp. N15]|uniref:1,4-dihydroxy-2-naphthoate octaprenyltransferase n=1 Tax=Lentibacillus songyuanensis TaxID=3136161 RepID=UPI0031BAE55D